VHSIRSPLESNSNVIDKGEWQNSKKMGNSSGMSTAVLKREDCARYWNCSELCWETDNPALQNDSSWH
jgi:hypothetical protein